MYSYISSMNVMSIAPYIITQSIVYIMALLPIVIFVLLLRSK
jgi:hypothetical protein